LPPKTFPLFREKSYPCVTSLFLGTAFSALGRVKVKTPSAILAVQHPRAPYGHCTIFPNTIFQDGGVPRARNTGILELNPNPLYTALFWAAATFCSTIPETAAIKELDSRPLMVLGEVGIREITGTIVRYSGGVYVITEPFRKLMRHLDGTEKEKH
jgi:hypothetical protein